jgi:hypothetical protein
MKERMKWFAVSAALIASALCGFHLLLIDGLDGLIFGLLLKEDTEYAAGYTDTKWRSIRIGMTEADVRAILGEPLQVWQNRGESVGMRWSRSPGDTNYRCRVILLENDRLVERHAEFHLD